MTMHLFHSVHQAPASRPHCHLFRYTHSSRTHPPTHPPCPACPRREELEKHVRSPHPGASAQVLRPTISSVARAAAAAVDAAGYREETLDMDSPQV